MCSFVTFLVLVLAMINTVHLRPPQPIGYFPGEFHPWSTDDDDGGIRNNYIESYKQSLGQFEDAPFPKNKLRVKFYPKSQDGFVPVDMTSLNNVYWWRKRFQGLKGSTAEDIPYYDNVDPKVVDLFNTGTVKKRDYTAAQLVNMLKALAKARRQRQIRITGKGLRFGISK
ncbi:uncharacterized protein NPIL_545421 [Nephila pilipes]|uniref:Uncharacterized protein n=1 Tax=Nephila pilipes TaxID=299642 RepID=A0A8X6IBE4_NEPPI|nr:uncharacterized protein NPIL_545421 [Nephila pilipes]